MSYFCPLPWIHKAIRANGNLRVCCHANHGPQHGILKDETGNNLNVDSLDDYNAPLLNEIRSSILKDEWHPECVRCQHEVEAGMKSRSEYESIKWDKVFKKIDAVEITNSDGTLKEKPQTRYLDVRFGNLCNLKCRTCGPTDSSAWYDDYAALNNPSFNDTHGKVELVKNDKGKFTPKHDVYNWHTDENFWSKLNEYIPDLHNIYFVGGEPLLINNHYDFLQLCVTKGYAKDITLEYNTNLTNVPQRAYDVWEHFKEIRIGVSVDGVGEVNDYIRYPSKWSQIEKNLHKIDNAEGNFTVWLAVTVQTYNVLHFPDIMMWVYQQDFKRIRNLITPHPVHNPAFLNIKAFPESIKQEIEICYEKKKEEIRTICNDVSVINKFDSALDSYIKYMNQEDLSEHFEKFIQYTTDLDLLRFQSLEKSVPDLNRMINAYKNR